jgi:acyl-CoA thioesterase I
MATLRICFVGDSITAGTGDEQYLGWPGRLCAAETARGHGVTLYNLGIRGDTSVQIQARWRAECIARLPPPHAAALVFAFGVNDVVEEGLGQPRVAAEDGERTARAILSEAKAWMPTLMIGPAPVDESKMPMTVGLVHRDLRNARIAAISRRLARIAAEVGVPYLDVYSLLAEDPSFARALVAGDGVHPDASGYAILAATIGAWLGWRGWFDG